MYFVLLLPLIFRKFIRVLFYFSWLLHSCYLGGSFYQFLWRGDKGLWYRNISPAYHCWHELWHYVLLFFELGEAFKVKGNKYTHIHTCTHKHTHAQVELENSESFSFPISSYKCNKKVANKALVKFCQICWILFLVESSITLLKFVTIFSFLSFYLTKSFLHNLKLNFDVMTDNNPIITIIIFIYLTSNTNK